MASNGTRHISIRVCLRCCEWTSVAGQGFGQLRCCSWSPHSDPPSEATPKERVLLQASAAVLVLALLRPQALLLLRGRTQALRLLRL